MNATPIPPISLPLVSTQQTNNYVVSILPPGQPVPVGSVGTISLSQSLSAGIYVLSRAID